MGASKAELIAVKQVDSRFENTVVVVVVVVVVVMQQGVDCSGQGLDGCAVGMAVENWEGAVSECREGAEDGTLAVVEAMVDIAVAAAANKVAGEEGVAAVVVGAEAAVSEVRLDTGCIAGGAAEATSRQETRRRVAEVVQVV